MQDTDNTSTPWKDLYGEIITALGFDGLQPTHRELLAYIDRDCPKQPTVRWQRMHLVQTKQPFSNGAAVLTIDVKARTKAEAHEFMVRHELVNEERIRACPNVRVIEGDGA